MSQPLSAPMTVGFDYTRSLGPTLSPFMTGLAQRRILGSVGADGRVHAPPLEYDPATAQPLTELVEVADRGTVVTWSWVPWPLDGQPLAHPFAWALIRLDGADTSMLHAVDAGTRDRIHTGMRVRVRWSDRPRGDIHDIACFEPLDGPEPATGAGAGAATGAEPVEATGAEPEDPATAVPVTGIVTPIHLRYLHTASPEESRYLRALAEGRFVGQRCPACGKVYIPPRGACPTDGVPTADEVELPDHGVVTTFCVVNVPFPGQRVKPPYVTASVLLDGADIPFGHLILGCPADEVRMGMRVRAVWRPRDQWGTTLENVDHFAPTGQPDAPFESYAQHL